jgi:hypothetical protein
VKLNDGTIAVIHINRLKRAHLQKSNETASPVKQKNWIKNARAAWKITPDEDVAISESRGPEACSNPQVIGTDYIDK